MNQDYTKGQCFFKELLFTEQCSTNPPWPRLTDIIQTEIRCFKIVWPSIVTDSLWIRPTDALKCSFFGITTLHVSGSLCARHQEFLAVHRLCTFYAVVMNVCYQSRVELQFNPTLVANVHHNCIKCNKADVRLRTPDDGQKGWPKYVES